MNKKGKVDSIAGDKVTVWFPDMDNVRTTELPVMKFVLDQVDVGITDVLIGSSGEPTTITGKMSGTLTQKLNIGDVVLVMFWSGNMKDGAVIGRVDA
ncbi:MAG TPA: hypothetical protein VEG39_01805 [Clostridia bacterium]|nr:hypothetical protein [Clostridia bacterium]